MADFSYEWDEAKRAANHAKHGLDFPAVELFDWGGAIVVPDLRRYYGEARYRAFGTLVGLPCMVAFTRRGMVSRVISLRRANARERKRYGLRGQEDVPAEGDDRRR